MSERRSPRRAQRREATDVAAAADGAAVSNRTRRFETVTVVRRSVALVVLAGAAVGAMVVDHRPRPESVGQFGARPDVPMPAIRPAASLGATWFCPGVPAGADGLSGSVVLANPTDLAARAVVTVTPGGAGTPAVKTIDVVERSRLELSVDEFVKAPFAAIQVETQSGALAVEQISVARLDAGASAGNDVRAVSACANEPSEHWYFADGATTTDANETLLVYNPFPDDAVVDLTFADDTSVRRPGRLQALPVPPRSLVTVPIGDVVQRKEQVSVALSARSGRVVLGRQQIYASKPRRTLVAGLGTPSAGRQWTFADVEQTGAEAPGSAATVFALYNPGDLAADVTISLLPASGSVPGAALAGIVEDPSSAPASGATSSTSTSLPTSDSAPAPGAGGDSANVGAPGLTLTATVDAGGNALIPIAGTGIPDGRYSALVTSSAPIVAERQLRRTGDPRVVTTVQFGSRLTARRWEFATAAPAGWAPTLIVANTTTTDASVTVRTLGAAGLVAVASNSDVRVPAGGMARLDLSAAGVGQSALVVESNVEIVVERLIAPSPDRPGSSASLGMPEVNT